MFYNKLLLINAKIVFNFSFSPILHSLCICFACGVFLATCFLGLIPHIRMQEAMLQNLFYPTPLLGKADNSSNLFFIGRVLLDSNLMILVGFLLILVLGQVYRF